MTNDFIFPLFHSPDKHVAWNPDTAQNAHMMITGGSGAGKTRLVKEIMSYLHRKGKNLHVIDVQDTLGMPGIERVFDFDSRNSPYSINPFEFLMDEKSGGPNAQIDDIIEMFRKSFMKRMGPLQSAVLHKLISDTYEKAGFIDGDVSTWGMGQDKKELAARLPVIADMKELVDYILDYVSGGYGAKFSSIIASRGRQLNQWHNDMPRLMEELSKIEAIDGGGDEKVARERQRIEAEINDLKLKIQKKIDELKKYFEEHLHYLFLDGSVPAYEALLEDGDSNYGFLDYKFYSNKDRLKTIQTIETYLSVLQNAGVFGRNTPIPSFSEINRYNLASLKDAPRSFCADILVSKIFRMVYVRGEYKQLPVGNRIYKERREGTTTDTFITIDEMQTLLPDTAAEAKNKNLLYNRVISQIRNFGGGVLCLSQTPDNFPELFHTNIPTKIILNTAASDIPRVKAVTGIKDPLLFEQLEHKNKEGNYDVALMKDRTGKYVAVRLPWFS